VVAQGSGSVLEHDIVDIYYNYAKEPDLAHRVRTAVDVFMEKVQVSLSHSSQMKVGLLHKLIKYVVHLIATDYKDLVDAIVALPFIREDISELKSFTEKVDIDSKVICLPFKKNDQISNHEYIALPLSSDVDTAMRSVVEAALHRNTTSSYLAPTAGAVSFTTSLSHGSNPDIVKVPIGVIDKHADYLSDLYSYASDRVFIELMLKVCKYKVSNKQHKDEILNLLPAHGRAFYRDIKSPDALLCSSYLRWSVLSLFSNNSPYADLSDISIAHRYIVDIYDSLRYGYDGCFDSMMFGIAFPCFKAD
jgi:hypothetical protein